MPHVTIDRDGCISCANCWTVCPDVFEENPEDAKSRLVERYRAGAELREGDTPDELADCARQAADECPVAVIEVA
jgi:ferredoxin